MIANQDLERSLNWFLVDEGKYLDLQDWDAWLDLYDQNATYWAPMFDDFGELTRDPMSEMSHIYYDNRSGLEERVYRIRRGKSAASAVIPPTCHSHMITGVEASGPVIRLNANWRVDYFARDKVGLNFGRAEYDIKKDGIGWKITKKKIIILNSLIDTMVDFYLI